MGKLDHIDDVKDPQYYMECYATEHAEADRELIEMVNEYNEDIAEVDLLHKSSLKAAVSKWESSRTNLERLVKDNPHLFEKKKSRKVEGVKFGFRKKKGKLVLPKNVEKFIKKMKKIIGIMKYKNYVKVEEKPQKLLLAKLSGKDLKSLGVRVIDDTDAPFVEVKSAGAKKVEDLLKTVLLETEGPNDG